MKRSTPLLRRKGLVSRRSTNTPTAAEALRFELMRDVGCVIAYALGLSTPCDDAHRVLGEIHHLTKGSRHGARRRGHAFAVCINQWSHRGVPLPDMTAEQCRQTYGPSYAEEPALFRETYPDDQLLELQNKLLRLHFPMACSE